MRSPASLTDVHLPPQWARSLGQAVSGETAVGEQGARKAHGCCLKFSPGTSSLLAFLRGIYILCGFTRVSMLHRTTNKLGSVVFSKNYS